MLTRRRLIAASAAALAAAPALSACGDGDAAADGAGSSGKEAGGFNLSPDQHRIRGHKVSAAAALVPAAVRKAGLLHLGTSTDSTPPLNSYATDDKTLIGVELDLATLIADTLGLTPHFEAVSWENLFVGLDSGKFDAVMSNVTVTEERKEKYDFATYRLDNIAFEAKKGTGWRVREAKDVAGKSIAVSSGTNQEKILVDWSEQNEKAGREPVDIRYYQRDSDQRLALQSGRIDAYLGPNPTVAYHVATSGQTQIIGRLSGGGPQIQGKIAVTTKKGNGLVDAYAAAVNHVIANGSYARVLKRWSLGSEAVTTSEINPKGLPKP